MTLKWSSGLKTKNHPFRSLLSPCSITLRMIAFVDGAFYIVSGRIASIDNDFVLGDEPDADRYEFLLDADMVRSSFPSASASSLTCPPSDAVASRDSGLSSPTATRVNIRCRAYTPSPPFPFPTVSPFPQAGAKKSAREFIFDIRNGAAATLVVG
jgi:hypothetical protein